MSGIHPRAIPPPRVDAGYTPLRQQQGSSDSVEVSDARMMAAGVTVRAWIVRGWWRGAAG
jgi:hypothetical protein